MAEAESPDVSILVPALNEQETIGELIERLLALPIRSEIVVIDDGSTDNTPEVLQRFAGRIVALRNERPSGKGMAIRKALEVAAGKVVAIQDADLEYYPEDLPALVGPILDGSQSVVFGTRFSKGMTKGMALPNKLVNVLLVWAVRVLFGRRITDEATCYKVFRRDVLLRMHLQCRRFEFCPEVTAKAIRLGERIFEVPIRYAPRSKEAGKKIRWTDGVEAFWTLLRHRFGRF